MSDPISPQEILDQKYQQRQEQQLRFQMAFFTQFPMSEEETAEGSYLTELQKRVISNLRAGDAYAILNMRREDFESDLKYHLVRARFEGRIEAFSYLVENDAKDAVERRAEDAMNSNSAVGF